MPTPKFRQLLVDFLGDFFSFDSKIFRSLKPLLIRPGQMTKAYLEGKQIRFIPPLRLFLFLSVVLVLVISTGNEFRELNLDSTVKQSGIGEDTLSQAFIDSMRAGGTDSLIIDELIKSRERGIQITKMMEEGYTPNEIVDSLWSEPDLVTRVVVSQTIKLQQTKGKGFTGYVISNLSIMLAVTLFALAIWFALLDIRHKRSFLEHLIHSMHIHAFLIVGFIVLHILYLITGYPLQFVLLLPFAWHLWKSIKTVYGQGKWKSFWKAALSYLIYVLLIFPITLVIMLLVTFVLY